MARPREEELQLLFHDGVSRRRLLARNLCLPATEEEVRILHVTDTHFGHALPLRPKSARTRRGPDFFTRFERVVAHAIERADLVIHTGDVFFRSKVPRAIVDRAYALILALADRVPVVVLPGNHDRSRMPTSLFFRHERLHVIDRPRVVHLDVAGARLAVAGAPFVRDFQRVFPDMSRALAEQVRADRALLCVHQAFAGDKVRGHTFSVRDPEVADPRAVDARFNAILCGHIHRRQRRTIEARAVELLHAGALTPTSFQHELGEPKGFLEVDLSATTVGARFVEVERRPQLALEVARVDDLAALARAPPRAWVRLTNRAGLSRALIDAHTPDEVVVDVRSDFVNSRVSSAG